MSPVVSEMTSLLSRFHRRIEEKSRDNSVPGVVIVALGDSVTAGLGIDDYFHEDVYHAQFKRMLERRYPRCIFSVINAGSDGQNATGGVAQFERDVPHHRPDLILVGFGLNDATQGTASVPSYAKALENLVSRAQETTEADMILLTPNMMPRYDNGNVPARWQHLTETFIRLQKEGCIAAYAACAREVGTRCRVAVADVYGAWEALELQGVDTTALLANGLNHPNAAGHRLASEVLFRVVETQ